jgi:hypothetical protein
LFSPQISAKSLSHSRNKGMELKKEKRKRKVLKKERKELQKPLMLMG